MKTKVWLVIAILGWASVSLAARGQDEKIFSLLKAKEFPEAGGAIAAWEKQGGASDPDFWVVKANYYVQLARHDTVAISPIPPGEYTMKADADHLTITDPNTGKAVGGISDGVPTYDKEKMAMAIGALEKASILFPWRLDILTGRAHLYRLNQNFEGEIKSLRGLVSQSRAAHHPYFDGKDRPLDEPLDDYLVQMLTDYSHEHFEKETPTEDAKGVTVAKLVIELFPERAHGYNLMAAYCSFNNDWAGALGWLNQASSKDPKDSLVLNNLGYCYAKMGQKDKAKSSYQKVLSLNNDSNEVETAKERLKQL